MKVGDLVKVVDNCSKPGDKWHPMGVECACFFCAGNSNRIGYVLGPAQRNSWSVMFDCGEWKLDDFEEARGEVKVISQGKRI